MSIFGVYEVEKKFLQSWLPPNMDFSKQDITQEGFHPIVFMLNSQKIKILSPCFGLSYWEWIPLLPYVHFKSEPNRPFQMSPILYVNSRLIVWGAQLVWKLNKVFATFEPKEQFPSPKFAMSITRNKQTTVQLTSDTNKLEWKTPEIIQNLQKVLPLLTTEAAIYAPSTQTYRIADYRFNLLKVADTSLHLNLKMPEMPFIHSVDIPPISKQAIGAFWGYFQWKLQWPQKINP